MIQSITFNRGVKHAVIASADIVGGPNCDCHRAYPRNRYVVHYVRKHPESGDEATV
jgi:hypothetical protein